ARDLERAESQRVTRLQGQRLGHLTNLRVLRGRAPGSPPTHSPMPGTGVLFTACARSSWAASPAPPVRSCSSVRPADRVASSAMPRTPLSLAVLDEQRALLGVPAHTGPDEPAALRRAALETVLAAAG